MCHVNDKNAYFQPQLQGRSYREIRENWRIAADIQTAIQRVIKQSFMSSTMARLKEERKDNDIKQCREYIILPPRYSSLYIFNQKRKRNFSIFARKTAILTIFGQN